MHHHKIDDKRYILSRFNTEKFLRAPYPLSQRCLGRPVFVQRTQGYCTSDTLLGGSPSLMHEEHLCRHSGTSNSLFRAPSSSRAKQHFGEA